MLKQAFPDPSVYSTEILEEIIGYNILPYLFGEESFDHVLGIISPEKGERYKVHLVSDILGQKVDDKTADFFIRLRYESLEDKLSQSASEGYLPIVEYLVEAKANIHDDHDNALRWAANNGHVSVVQYLIEAKADIHALDDCALQWAAGSGHLSVVQYLVEAKADIHADNDNVLHPAAVRGHLPVVRYLVEAKADLYIDDVLQSAAQYNHLSVVRYLIGAGANIHFENDEVLRYEEETRSK